MTKSISTRTTSGLQTFFFINDNEGWIAPYGYYREGGEIQGMYHTKNGGETFDFIPTDGIVNTIHFLDSLTGYIGMQEGRVHKTTDGGKNWTILFPLIGSPVLDIDFPKNGTNGFCIAMKNDIHTISPSGTNVVEISYNSEGQAISCTSETEAWGAYGSVFVHVKDNSQVLDQGGGNGNFSSIQMLDDSIGWACGSVNYWTDSGNNGKIVKTEDGKIWEDNLLLGERTVLNSIFFLNKNTGWAAGYDGVLIHTSNGGESWNVDTSFSTDDYSYFWNKIFFTNPLNGFVAGAYSENGNYGKIYKYTLLSESDSTNATLSNITIDDVSLENFNSGTYEYSVELPAGTTEIPKISATATVNGAAVNITQATALPGTATIIVTAKDGETQQTYTIHFSVITGIENFEKQNELNIYPNPASDIIYFKVPAETTPFNLKIIDVHGRVVCSQKSFSAKSIDVSDLQAGVYFLSLQSKNETLNTRFIKK